MKAVVFGGSGFLGSHVADALTNAGYDTTVYDIKSSPYLQKSQKMVVGDILDKKAVDKAVKTADIVYNFAGMADIDEAQDKPLAAIEGNILGNTIILEACRKNKIKRFVFASSLYVYSNLGSFYRSSKQACELIIENYNEVYGIPYTILRYGSLYGPRATERNYIYNIIKQAITKGKISSFGDKEDLREYIHVEDAARGSVEILDKDFERECVILSGVEPLKRHDLIRMIQEMLGNKIDIEYLPTESKHHYKITPYAFKPKTAKKLVSKYYLDIGQGMLECIQNVYDDVHNPEENSKSKK